MVSSATLKMYPLPKDPSYGQDSETLLAQVVKDPVRTSPGPWLGCLALRGPSSRADTLGEGLGRCRPDGRCGRASLGPRETPLCCLLSLCLVCCPHLASCPSRCERKESGGRESGGEVTSRSWQLCVLLFTLEGEALGEMRSKGVDGSILTLRTSAMPTRVS